MTDAVAAHAIAHFDDFLVNLIEWCRIPSVSAKPSEKEHVRASAKFVFEKMKALGADCTWVETSGHPAVIGKWVVDPEAKTLLIYGHHDVQPAEPFDQWKSPAFEPQVRDGKLYARGAVDDKGQVHLHFAAIESFMTAGKLPLNITFLIEGEEEIGSMHLDEVIEKERALLAADFAVVSDNPMFANDLPTICVGLRGMVYVEVTVRGLALDCHSGTYGGGVPNAVTALSRMIAQLHDDHGRVLIDGFYDQVRALSGAERVAIASLPFDEKAWKQAVGATSLTGESGYSTLERVWARPTLEICGIVGGYTGAGAKTIVPATATAKISCRLVVDQEPLTIAKLLENRILELAKQQGVQAEVRYLHGGMPFLSEADHPVFEVARDALQTAFGKPCVLSREGGSVPFVRTIADLLKKPCILVGFGTPDQNAHAPNEWLGIENYRRGIIAMIHLYRGLATL